MSDPTPIRRLVAMDARWALGARPGDPVPQHPGHFVRATDYSIGDNQWATITCSCGETFSGALGDLVTSKR